MDIMMATAREKTFDEELKDSNFGILINFCRKRGLSGLPNTLTFFREKGAIPYEYIEGFKGIFREVAPGEYLLLEKTLDILAEASPFGITPKISPTLPDSGHSSGESSISFAPSICTEIASSTATVLEDALTINETNSSVASTESDLHLENINQQLRAICDQQQQVISELIEQLNIANEKDEDATAAIHRCLKSSKSIIDERENTIALFEDKIQTYEKAIKKLYVAWGKAREEIGIHQKRCVGLKKKYDLVCAHFFGLVRENIILYTRHLYAQRDNEALIDLMKVFVDPVHIDLQCKIFNSLFRPDPTEFAGGLFADPRQTDLQREIFCILSDSAPINKVAELKEIIKRLEAETTDPSKSSPETLLDSKPSAKHPEVESTPFAVAHNPVNSRMEVSNSLSHVASYNALSEDSGDKPFPQKIELGLSGAVTEVKKVAHQASKGLAEIIFSKKSALLDLEAGTISY